MKKPCAPCAAARRKLAQQVKAGNVKGATSTIKRGLMAMATGNKKELTNDN